MVPNKNKNVISAFMAKIHFNCPKRKICQ